MPRAIDQVNLFDPELFRVGPPHDVFDRLRRDAPVYWCADTDDPDGGFWALTRHADVLAVSRDPERFTSSLGFSAPRRRAEELGLFTENIMFRDPPAHTQHRKPLNRSFTPKAMNELEGRVRVIVAEVLDGLSELEQFDWVPEVAAEIPARVVASVVGVPESDHGKIVEWASDIFAMDGSPESAERFGAAVQAIMAYAEVLKEVRRKSPDDDIMSLLLGAEVDGAPLTEGALSMWFLSLAQAGFETTHTLIAQSMVILSDRPELRERLREDPGATSGTVEEMLRFVTPVNMMARTAVEDVELHGQEIRAGQYVTMWYSAANRDPDIFADPHAFDIDRSPNNHQAFGASGSPHFCLGAHLARLEMRVLLDELAARGFPHEVAGAPERMPGVFMNALRHLRVTSHRPSR